MHEVERRHPAGGGDTRKARSPQRFVDGQDESPPQLLLEGIAQFNRGDYWECHETLEALWRREARPVRDLYQGILQVGVACYHIRRGNCAGAVKVLRRGLLRLRDLPDPCQGVPVASLARAAEQVYDEVLRASAGRHDQLQAIALPRIEMDGLS